MADTYRITRHEGDTATCNTSGTLIYSSLDGAVAFKFYSLLRPASGNCIALWKPDGSLAASKSGAIKPAE